MRLIHHSESHLCDQVVLHTSFGDLDIELWPKEAPKVRNDIVLLSSNPLLGYTESRCFPCRQCGTLCSFALKGTMMGLAFIVSSKTTFCKVAMLQAQGLVESQCMANPSGMSSILGCVSLTGDLLCSLQQCHLRLNLKTLHVLLIICGCKTRLRFEPGRRR